MKNNSYAFKDFMQPTDLLNQATMDLIIFKSQHRVWINQTEVWRKWLRAI